MVAAAPTRCVGRTTVFERDVLTATLVSQTIKAHRGRMIHTTTTTQLHHLVVSSLDALMK